MQIDGYDQFELLGSGGYSRVWRAYQPSFGRHVAIKVLTFDVLDKAAVRSFERECQAMGRVAAHPNIVSVLGNGRTNDGKLYIAMEYFGGGNYSDRMRAERISVRDVLATGVKVSAALATAHQAGILHRDLKPANVLVSSFGEPALSDFGISTIDRERTTTGTAGMTVHYAPPEILNGEASDVRSDIYSLGATLWALLQGHKPFHNPSDESVAATAVRIMSKPAEPIVRTDCPPELRFVVLRAMAKRRADRYESALEIAQDLREIQAALGYPTTELVFRSELGEAVTERPRRTPSQNSSSSASRRSVSRPTSQTVVQLPSPLWQRVALGGVIGLIVVLLVAVTAQLA